MQYLRNLLYLILVAGALDLGAAPQVQNQPTSWIYVQQNSSYDGISRDQAGAALNGQNGKNPAHLGAKFSGPYVDQGNAFGIYAWDLMLTYGNGAALNGLDLGFGYWPQITNSTAYVDQVNEFPAFAWDELTNYLNGANLNGLNAGNDNGSVVQWNGPYNDPCIDPPPDLRYSGGLIVAGVTVPGYDTIFISFDGTAPTGGSQGAVSTIAFASWPPTGVWTYDGAFALPANATAIKATQGHGVFGFCNVSNLGPALSFGQTWSNNVVANGGANPSTTTVAALNVMGAGLNNDQLLNQSLSAFPSLTCLNLMAPDSLIAATTPCIYYKGNQPWVNHNFVGGDIGANGLTGNGTTKYLDTGLNPSTEGNMTSTSAGCYAYVYDNSAAASGYAIGLGTAALNSHFGVYPSGSGGTDSQGYVWRFDAPNIINAPKPSPPGGFFSIQRTTASRLDLYFANSGAAHSSIGNSTGAQTGSILNGSTFAFAVNGIGTPSSWSVNTISAIGFSFGLSSAQDSNLYNRIQACRVSLGGGSR
jgi:hypothetical protein